MALMVKFKYPVDQASPNSNTFKLADSSNVAVDGQISVDPANNAVMFKPNSILQGSEKYRVIITGGATCLFE